MERLFANVGGSVCEGEGMRTERLSFGETPGNLHKHSSAREVGRPRAPHLHTCLHNPLSTPAQCLPIVLPFPFLSPLTSCQFPLCEVRGLGAQGVCASMSQARSLSNHFLRETRNDKQLLLGRPRTRVVSGDGLLGVKGITATDLLSDLGQVTEPRFPCL